MSTDTRLGGRTPTRRELRDLERENARWPAKLAPVPAESWPPHEWMSARPVGIWRSSDFLVIHYVEPSGAERLTMQSTHAVGAKDWRDGFGWDVLQRLKREAGFADRYAVEVYPDDVDIVNVGNLRHLWLLDAPPPYAWRREEGL